MQDGTGRGSHASESSAQGRSPGWVLLVKSFGCDQVSAWGQCLPSPPCLSPSGASSHGTGTLDMWPVLFQALHGSSLMLELGTCMTLP